MTGGVELGIGQGPRTKWAGSGIRRLRAAVVMATVVLAVAGASMVTVQSASAAAGGSTLSAGQKLQAGQDLVSSGGQYKLDMQGDGNLVIYENGSAIWASSTAGTGSANYLVMQGDGNLVVYNRAGKPVWASNTAGTGSANYLVMQGDGNLVVYNRAGKPVWASNTAGGASIGQEILSYAEKYIGKVHYCWDGGSTAGPTHGKGNYRGEAPDCSSSSTTGFDCSGLALYAIYKATGKNLFPVAHSAALINYGTRVSQSSMRVGDIIAFDNGEHFAIYAGVVNGTEEVVDADTSFYKHPDGVYESPLSWYLTAYKITQVLRF
jgi:cell wall-associated NlpC family hydrolase